ncbi:hypothetical protein BGZ73_007629 [Actinomortierella ambigua]|nr:hypothetical protein BGZ73_007629 [Actinomortierella ambigua]
MSPKKIYVMTGGNVGIGLECAKVLLQTENNVHLILGCRDKTRAEAGVAVLQMWMAQENKETNNTVEYWPLDLASFASTRSFAAKILETYPQGIHTLVLNAGVVMNSRTKTADGYETSVQVNHLSQFLLAALLLPALEKATSTWPGENGCITLVASSLHIPGAGRGRGPELTIENVDGSKDYEGMLIYRNTKLLQMLCFHGQASRLFAKHPHKVTINACSPGFVPTTALKRDSDFATRLMMDNVMSRLPFASTVDQAGKRVYNCISKFRGLDCHGLYYDKDVVTTTGAEARDLELQDFWWKWTLDAVGLKEEQF